MTSRPCRPYHRGTTIRSRNGNGHDGHRGRTRVREFGYGTGNTEH